jgi:hypothetical protein
MDDGIASQLKKLVDDELAKVSGRIGGQPRRPDRLRMRRLAIGRSMDLGHQTTSGGFGLAGHRLIITL